MQSNYLPDNVNNSDSYFYSGRKSWKKTYLRDYRKPHTY